MTSSTAEPVALRRSARLIKKASLTSDPVETEPRTETKKRSRKSTDTEQTQPSKRGKTETKRVVKAKPSRTSKTTKTTDPPTASNDRSEEQTAPEPVQQNVLTVVFEHWQVLDDASSLREGKVVYMYMSFYTHTSVFYSKSCRVYARHAANLGEVNHLICSTAALTNLLMVIGYSCAVS
jgi:hypothetical protein